MYVKDNIHPTTLNTVKLFYI